MRKRSCSFGSGKLISLEKFALFNLQVKSNSTHIIIKHSKSIYFRYIIVICWTSIHLLLRLASIISPYIRLLLLCNRCRSSNRSDINTVLQKCNYGDWFLLMQMAKHIRPNILHQLMLDLRDKFDKKRALHEDTD